MFCGFCVLSLSPSLRIGSGEEEENNCMWLLLSIKKENTSTQTFGDPVPLTALWREETDAEIEESFEKHCLLFQASLFSSPYY